MTDKEKLEAIRAEIHRLVDVRGYDRGMAIDLFAFMDSLPNGPVSDELEEAAYQFGNCFESHFELASMSFIKGAKWQKEQMIDKACEWLEEHLLDFWSQKITNTDYFIEEFKKQWRNKL